MNIYLDLHIKWFLILFILLLGCSKVEIQKNMSFGTSEEEKYNLIVKEYLNKRDFTNPKYLSYLNDMLSVPQEYAFTFNEEKYIKDFEEYYLGMSIHFEEIKSLNVVDYGLTRLEVIKLLSQFLKLQELNKRTSINESLIKKIFSYVISEIEYFYKVQNPGWPPKYNGNVEERVNWAISAWERNEYDKSLPKNHYAINDDLWRLFEAAANIKKYITLSNNQSFSFIDELLKLSYACVSKFGNTENNTYAFQPGALFDHIDLKYAGHLEISDGMSFMPISSIENDSSHFSMFPSMISALKNAYPKNSYHYNFYEEVNRKIGNAFYEKVVLYNNNSVFTKNYMDGTNGLYRYDDKLNDAYLPYEVSGTILFGTWSFLNHDNDEFFFKSILESFPLSKKTISIYQSKFSRNKDNYSVFQIENLYSDPNISIYSLFALRIAKRNKYFN